jgi:ABC-type Co2+ transport system permease subunit
MTIPMYHTGDDWPITMLLNEANSSGVLVPFVNTGATFTMSVVNLARTATVVAAVSGTLTATGCSGTFLAANTGAVTPGTYRIEVQALQGGLKTSWSDAIITVVPGTIA